MAADPSETAKERARPSRFWRKMRRHPLAWAGVVGLVGLFAFSFIGPHVYRASVDATHLGAVLQPPGPQFPLGTNNIGRNELARLMVGGQVSLEVGFAAALASMVIGAAYGIVAGYKGGWTDAVLMRIVDGVQSIPPIFVLIFIDSFVRPSAGLLIVLIALVSWTGVSRLVRAETLVLKEQTYVEAATAQGVSGPWIMIRHIFPNLIATVLVTTTFMVGNAIILVAALSFLGLGLPPPAPNWGTMLANSMNYVTQNDWWLVYPAGFAILIAVISVNFVGDALRDSFEMRMDQPL